MNDVLKSLCSPDELASCLQAELVCQFPNDATSGNCIPTSDLAQLLVVIDRLSLFVPTMRSAGSKIDPKIREALITYARDHKAAGSFVMACVRNDLAQAATRADPSNLRDLAEIMRFIINELPSPCWGSEAKVAAWLVVKGPTPLPDLREPATTRRVCDGCDGTGGVLSTPCPKCNGDGMIGAEVKQCP
jgi:hypothetical protein